MASVILCVYWLVFSSVTAVLGIFYICNDKLPQTLLDLLLFGKSKNKKRTWTAVQLIEVPKKWFVHFYIVGCVINGYVLYVVLCAYLLGQHAPTWLVTTLQVVTLYTRNVTTDAASAIVLIGFMFIQNFRRLLECLFVSVYSKSSMNVVHYVMGLSLYSLFHLSVLCEAPSLFTVRIDDPQDDFLLLRHVAGALIFFWASWQQHKIHHAFADLRKTEKGQVKSLQHKIPEGGWFEYVSCPHYTMEIIIYFSFLVIAGFTHVTLWTVWLFVLSNQLVSAGMSHHWYRKTFKSYPQHRKAVIPYLL